MGFVSGIGWSRALGRSIPDLHGVLGDVRRLFLSGIVGGDQSFFDRPDVPVADGRNCFYAAMRLLIVERLAKITDAFCQVLLVDFMAVPEAGNDLPSSNDAMPFFHKIEKNLEPLSADGCRRGSAR